MVQTKKAEQLAKENETLKLRVRALELDNQRLLNLLNMTPPSADTGKMSLDDLGELEYQIGSEIARRHRETKLV